MANKVKTTTIEKKTKAGGTVKINFAKVVDRLNEFREANPHGLVETTPTIEGDVIIFKTRILKDKSNANSAEATGHAMGRADGSEKQFEKLETISVGRALALLGYAASGEIASDEEMEEFYSYKEAKKQEAIDKLMSATTIDNLRETFMSLGNLIADSEVQDAKDERKAQLNENSTPTSK